VEELKDVIRQLSYAHSTSFVQTFVDIRSKFLSHSLMKLFPERMCREYLRYSYHFLTVATFHPFIPFRSSLIKISLTAVSAYKRGAHPFIKFVHVCLELLQKDHELAIELLACTSQSRFLR